MKKDKKGQMAVGGIIMMAIVVIVCVGAFLPQIFNNQEAMRTTYTYTTNNYDAPTAGATVDLVGQTYLSTATIVNESGVKNCANNFTIQEGISTSTNLKTIQITGIADTATACDKVNISYTYGPNGYIEDSGGRTVAGLIGIFSALAILGVIIFWYIKENGWIFNF